MLKAVQPCNVKPAIPESIARSSKLLNWCQRQTEGYRNVRVTDLTMSWKSGLALCALIDRYRPDLMWVDLRFHFPSLLLLMLLSAIWWRCLRVSYFSPHLRLAFHMHSHEQTVHLTRGTHILANTQTPVSHQSPMISYAIRGCVQPDLLRSTHEYHTCMADGGGSNEMQYLGKSASHGNKWTIGERKRSHAAHNVQMLLNAADGCR